MLHLKALPSCTLDLLISLSANPALASFALVGGTSLALRMGHRLSVDLDWFSQEPFDSEALSEALKQRHRFSPIRQFENGLMGVLDDVRCDFALYRYAFLEPLETIDGVRMLSLPDVIAMKLSALSNRGAKKDFYDVHALIQENGLPALIQFYQRKFPDNDPMIVLRSLTYFDDAEPMDDPVSLTGVRWTEVKEVITNAVYNMTTL